MNDYNPLDVVIIIIIVYTHNYIQLSKQSHSSVCLCSRIAFIAYSILIYLPINIK